MSLPQKLPLPPLTSDQARALAKQRRHPGGRNARAMFAEAQELLLKDIRNKKTTPAIRAKCVIALDKCEERLRILNGKPLPGQLRPDGDWRTPKKRKSPSLLPLPEVPAAVLVNSDSVPIKVDTPKECESASVSGKAQ